MQSGHGYSSVWGQFSSMAYAHCRHTDSEYALTSDIHQSLSMYCTCLSHQYMPVTGFRLFVTITSTGISIPPTLVANPATTFWVVWLYNHCTKHTCAKTDICQHQAEILTLSVVNYMASFL